MYTTGEEVEVRLGPESDDFCLALAISPTSSALLRQVHTYQRLTPFTVLDQAVESLDNLRPGDCIVCFSKNDIYSISRQIEARGLECAVIYGSLPPGETRRICLCVSIGTERTLSYCVIHRHQVVAGQKV